MASNGGSLDAAKDALASQHFTEKGLFGKRWTIPEGLRKFTCVLRHHGRKAAAEFIGFFFFLRNQN
jgi:hypothetical protein